MITYLFTRLPGMLPTWTLAVLATSPTDARRHVKATWRGGALTGTVTGGNIHADCGAITDAAADETHWRMAEYQAETDRMIAAGELEPIPPLC